MFFRSEPSWQVVEPFRDIGWRLRKQFYLIGNKSDPRAGRHLLSWVGGADDDVGREDPPSSVVFFCSASQALISHWERESWRLL